MNLLRTTYETENDIGIAEAKRLSEELKLLQKEIHNPIYFRKPTEQTQYDSTRPLSWLKAYLPKKSRIIFEINCNGRKPKEVLTELEKTLHMKRTKYRVRSVTGTF